MRTLISTYKAAYKRAKTSKGRTLVYNRAMLNLGYEAKVRFSKWQIIEMNKIK
jgi:hypothetical protein